MTLIEQLNAAGFPVRNVSDLYTQKHDYRSAVPLLVAALHEVQNNEVLEEIVRALSVKWAKPFAAKPLVELFGCTSDDRELGLRWVVGSALAVVADASVFDELVRLVRHRGYGRSREMLPLALAGMKSAKADQILITLLDDEDLKGHAMMAINKRGVMIDRASLEKVLEDPRAWVRKEARKARVVGRAGEN